MIAVEVTNECLGFVSNHKKCKVKFKKAKYVSSRFNDLFSEKNILGLGALSQICFLNPEGLVCSYSCSFTVHTAILH